MKRVFVVMAALLALLIEPAEAGNKAYRDQLITSGARFAQSAKTLSGFVYVAAESATVNLAMSYLAPSGKTYTISPDSGYLMWSAKGTTTADSVGLIFTKIPIARSNGPATNYTRTIADSAKVQENDYVALSQADLRSNDLLRILIGPSTGANKTQNYPNGGVQAVVWVRLWYSLPE